MQNKKIKTLNELYQELDKLYYGIYKFCKICKEEDCKGYVWLLPEETKKFITNDIPLIEINGRFNFIDSFHRKNDIINVEEMKPPCIFRKDGKKCSIYEIRPLVCRLYPLDFRVLQRQIYIVLHTDCLFIKKLIKNQDISQFVEKILVIFYSMNKKLLREIISEYNLINFISKYPKDYKYDDFIKVSKVVNLQKGEIKICQSAKRFLTLEK